MVHRDSNKELLMVVAAEVVICVKCDLWKTRCKAVPGTGSTETKILFIGEGPGESEDQKGEPFVGSAGKFLDELLSRTGFSRNEVFITNIVKCRPPANRDPLPIEIETCTPYLNRQIGIIEPKLIVTLGRHSTQYLFSKANLPFYSITRAHGRAYETSIYGMKVTIFPTFHPAAALYHPRYKDELLKDFQQLRTELLKRELIHA